MDRYLADSVHMAQGPIFVPLTLVPMEPLTPLDPSPNLSLEFFGPTPSPAPSDPPPPGASRERKFAVECHTDCHDVIPEGDTDQVMLCSDEGVDMSYADNLRTETYLRAQVKCTKMDHQPFCRNSCVCPGEGRCPWSRRTRS